MDIEDNPQGSLTWRQALLLGTVELGQVRHENCQVGQAARIPFKEQHDHIVAGKLPTHVQYVILGCPHIVETSGILFQ